MPRRRSYTPEQIITKLREAEILLSQGKTVKAACKQLEISEQTYYRWRREYGGMDVTQAKKLKEMEKENARLKKLVADLSLDNAILKEVLGKK
jgi:transposase-like protein